MYVDRWIKDQEIYRWIFVKGEERSFVGRREKKEISREKISKCRP